MMLIMALMDVIGVASIMPFMSVLANPDIIDDNAVLSNLYSTFNFQSRENFLFSLGLLSFILLIFSLIFKSLTMYAQLRFVRMREASISKRFVELYLDQSYDWFLSRDSSDLSKTVLSEIGTLVGNGIMPMLNLAAHGVVAIALLTLLMVVDPILALIVGTVLIAAYVAIILATKNTIASIGKDRIKANELRFSAARDAFRAIKEIKVAGLEKFYVKRFSRPSYNMAKYASSAAIISQLPRYFMEAIAFGGIFLVILFLMSQKNGLEETLPVIALYALAGYRVIPALQQVYAAITQLHFAIPAIDSLYSEQSILSRHVRQASKAHVLRDKNIGLINMSYTYPNNSLPAVKNITINIPYGSMVGFVGKSGSGKTTVVDIISGLISPQNGSLRVGEIVIDKYNREQWQSRIGYVPQDVYLINDTISANISFGVERNEADQDAIIRAAKIANLDEFVDSLPNKYETTVGERGSSLSGGQIQRIGIARAIYRNPEILIIDEGTSALDIATEREVMEALNRIRLESTIIIIAHRVDTLRACDSIYMFEKGEVISSGTYDKLLKSDKKFQNIAF